ncbi:hypothetical protein AERO9AM_70501 [Aeromicrobium sp. 9AM]|nr:hypothetical protein AERO9AM_70501 [Aeromicrobium sp. 9AM]
MPRRVVSSTRPDKVRHLFVYRNDTSIRCIGNTPVFVTQHTRAPGD